MVVIIKNVYNYLDPFTHGIKDSLGLGKEEESSCYFCDDDNSLVTLQTIAVRRECFEDNVLLYKEDIRVRVCAEHAEILRKGKEIVL